MSIKKFSESGIARSRFNGRSSVATTSTPYVRPADWPVLPVLTEADQRFVGLHAVYEEGNFVALSAAGDYMVDWGDGIVENYASGVVAYHEYSYANGNLGALTSRGYKTAIVSVTMQSGQTMTALNLHQKHSKVGLNLYSSGFLDIAIAGASLTDLRIGVQTPGSSTQTIGFYDLEIVNIVKSDLMQLSYLFNKCYSLQSVVGINISDTYSSGSVAFQDSGDTVTMAGHGFKNGNSVVFTTIIGTTGLTVGTRYYVRNATTDTFQVSTSYGGGAVGLTTDGSGAVAYGADMGSLLNECYSLMSVPLFNTVSVTNMSGMFNSCYSLMSVPLFNTQSVTSMSSMFSSCYLLMSVPLFNTVSVTNMNGMFNSCSSLTSVPLFDTSLVTNMGNMFSSCYSLMSVPLFNTSLVTDMSGMFGNCYSLTNISMAPIKVALSVTGCKLSEVALTTIIGNLSSLASTLTFTIGTNYGAPTPVSLSGTTTAGSTTVAMASTAGIEVGMQVTGTGTPTTTAIACTFTDAGDLVTKTAHGLSDGDEVSFATIVTTTGVLKNTIYYVVNKTTDTFQVALTAGGAPIALTTNGTGTLKYKATVVSINPNVNVTLSRPATGSSTNTLAFRHLKTNTAMLRGWTISG